MRQSLVVAVLLVASPLTQAAVSSYQQVYDVVFRHSIAPQPAATAAAAVYTRGQLPQYAVDGRVFFQGSQLLLRQDAQRTLNEQADYYPDLTKRLHRNGICFAGTWQIDQPSPYSGYFKQGSNALIIGRASVSLTETKRGQPRGFAFAGKLFPTQDKAQPVKTANFFVADVLAGVQRAHYRDAAMTNQPQLGFRWAAIPVLLQVARAFSGLDDRAGYRPVTQIAALDEQGVVRAPQWMMIKPVAGQRVSEAVDFRDELRVPQAQIDAWQYEIWVSDQASRPEQNGWQRLGHVRLEDSVVSFGCDRQLHFAHPRIKQP
jgi:hypothetical protein